MTQVTIHSVSFVKLLLMQLHLWHILIHMMMLLALLQDLLPALLLYLVIVFQRSNINIVEGLQFKLIVAIKRLIHSSLSFSEPSSHPNEWCHQSHIL